MRRLILAALVALIGFMPLAASAQTGSQGATPLSQAATDPNYPLWLGIGAFTGLVVANVVFVGWPTFASIPGMLPPGALVRPEWHTAMSRVYAVGFGVLGALVADGIYMDW